mgnify:FL=1
MIIQESRYIQGQDIIKIKNIKIKINAQDKGLTTTPSTPGHFI